MPPYLASYICCYLGIVHKLLGILYSCLLTTKDCLGSPQLFTLKVPYGVLEKWLRDEEHMLFFEENPPLVPWFPVSMLGHSQRSVIPFPGRVDVYAFHRHLYLGACAHAHIYPYIHTYT